MFDVLRSVLLFGGILIGSLALYVSLARSRTVSDVRWVIVQLSKSLWFEAEQANLSQDPCILRLHNQMIELAALAPYVAAGVVKAFPDDNISKEDFDETIEFFQRNRWVVNYAFTVAAALDRLEFHAAPWKVANMKAGFRGFVVMKLVTSRFEPTAYPAKPAEAAKGVQRIQNVTMNGHFVNVAHG